MSPLVDFIRVNQSGDTLINGIQCSILEKSTSVCDGRGNREFTYSQNGRVYFYEPVAGDFFKLYDFTLNAGNSLFYPLADVSGMSISDTLQVDILSVDTVFYNSVPLRHIQVSYSFHPNSQGFYAVAPTSEWLEGIGDINYMFPWYSGLCDFQWGQPLRCYQDSLIGFISFDPNLGCEDSVWMGISVPDSKPDISIYPNPAGAQLEVSSTSTQTALLELFEMNGRKVRTWNFSGTQLDLNVSDLARGAYFLRITSGTGRVCRKVLLGF